jgi:hypothetical protein
MSNSARSCGAGLGCAGSGVAVSIGRREVGRVAWAGRARARGRSVGHVGFGWSIGPLGPGNGSLVNHPS